MSYLLDTHAVLWWLIDRAKLSVGAAAVLRDPANPIYVSVVSIELYFPKLYALLCQRG